MRLRWAVSLLVLLMGINAIAKIEVDRRVRARKAVVDIRYLPSPQMMRFLSFDYRELLADITWIEALNYFGESLAKNARRVELSPVSAKPFDYLDQYVSLISSLDPFFVFFYEWAATVFIYNWMPMTKENIARSIRYGNLGIQRQAEIFRYQPSLIKKNAFNFAIETKRYDVAAEYLLLLSRISPADRDSALVAASYFDTAGLAERGRQAREEFFAYSFLENSSPEKRQEAFALTTSGGVNSGAMEMLRAARMEAERDENLKKLMKRRFQEDQSFFTQTQASQPAEVDYRIQKMMAIPTDRTQRVPPYMLLLFSI
jgi:hypothetical protein